MRLQPHQLRALTAHDQLVQAGHATAADFVMPPPIPGKPRKNEESRLQQSLLKWWAANHAKFGVPEILLFSIPNGGGRSGPVVGSILKKEGLRSGAPDLFLAAPRILAGWYVNEDKSVIGYTGLFLELKRPAGVVSPEQEVFHQRLQEQGYKVVVCRTLVECVNTITFYLTKP